MRFLYVKNYSAFRCLVAIIASVLIANVVILLLSNVHRYILNSPSEPWHTMSNGYAVSTVGTNHAPQPEKRHIVFLKVHKAASSTIQNVLLRFASSRNLSVLLNRKGIHVNENGTAINREKLIRYPDNKKFDVLANHIVFDHDEIAQYFPSSTVYVGIVRKPFQQFVSAFIYYANKWHEAPLVRCVKDNPKDPIGHFLRNPLRYAGGNPRLTMVNNRMMVDFGFPVKGFEAAKTDRKKIVEFVAKIHKTFDLVLISDMFDESVVLLRRFMNWHLKDILYIQKNVYHNMRRPNSIRAWEHRTNYSQEDFDLFSKWGIMDITLYNRSLEIFKSKIQQEKNFAEELNVFRQIRASVVSFCKNILEKKRLVVESNKWTKMFEVTQTDCNLMRMDEKSHVDLIRHKQLELMESGRNTTL